MMTDGARNDFPIFKNRPGLCFLDSAASAQKPYCVINAVSDFYANDYANIHRGMYELSETSTEKYEQARQTTATFLNAEANEIIFTKGATESLNLVSTVLNKSVLNDGDEVLVSIAEHHANFIPWQNTKASFKVFGLDDNLELDMEDLKAKLSKKTKVVAFTHMSNVTGIVNPVKQIVKLVRDYNPEIIIVVDGAQGIVHDKIDLKDVDVDFYAFSGHKIYGPSGIGVLYGKYDMLNKLYPYQFGGDMVKKVTVEKTVFAAPPARFEAGTPPIADAVGLAAAIDYIKNFSDNDNGLHHYAEERLSEIKGIKIIGNSSRKTGIISFAVDGVAAADIGTLLAEQNIAVRVGHHCAEPLVNYLGYKAVVRCSLGIYNNREDIDTLIKGLKKAVGMLKRV